MSLTHYILMCWKVWRSMTTRNASTVYTVAHKNGVPVFAMFVARDREAWRISQFAVDSNLTPQTEKGPVGDEPADPSP